MPLNTFIDTRTLSLASGSSGTLTHGIGLTPHMVWGVAKFSSATMQGTGVNIPYFSAKADSASVSIWNRGTLAETWSVYTVFLHSLIS